MGSSFLAVDCAAVDATVSPDNDARLLVAPADRSDLPSMNARTDVDLPATTSHRAVFVVLGVVLGVIFVVVLVLGFTCTLKYCQRLRHAGQSTASTSCLCIGHIC